MASKGTAQERDPLGYRLGIIQGRLTDVRGGVLQCFPDNVWKEEFPRANELGYAYIESFRDKEYNKYNPLWNEAANLEQVRDFTWISGTKIRSICDDYLMHCAWEDLALEQYLLLEGILFKAARLKAQIVVFPLMEKAELNSAASYDSFLAYIRRLAQIAGCLGLRIALELSRDSATLVQLFQDIDQANVGLCLDTGNLYTAGIMAEDILRDTRLKNKIFHVHLKDKDDKGNNVIPGTGNVDFKAVFRELYKIGYDGMLVTETARGSHAVHTAAQNKTFFRDIITSTADSYISAKG